METTGALIPQRHGGALRNGGTNKGGPGRTPNVIRAKFRADLPTEARKLRQHVRDMEKTAAAIVATFAEIPTVAQLRERLALEAGLFTARRQLADFLAKYGIGTTFTETDNEGNSVRKPFTFTIATPN